MDELERLRGLLRQIANYANDPEITNRVNEALNVDVPDEPKDVVYSHPECVFNYCPYVEICQPASTCQHMRKR